MHRRGRTTPAGADAQDARPWHANCCFRSVTSNSKFVLALALILAAGGLAGLSARGTGEPLEPQPPPADPAGPVVSGDTVASPNR
jgi:hypothetical protein